MRLLLVWLVWSVAVWVVARLLPSVRLRGFGTAIGVAAVYGVAQALLKWLLVLVIGVATLGIGFLLYPITSFIASVILLRLTDTLIEGFEIKGWGATTLAALLMTILASVGMRMLGL